MKKTALLSILILLTIIPLLKSEVLIVGEGEAYGNLNHAMHNVSDGDTVLVRKGIYPRSFTVYNSVVIMADSLHKAEIGDGTEGVCKIMRGTVIIDGFKFNTLANGPAVAVMGSQTDTVRNCIIRNNLINNRKSGILTSTFSWNCTIENNLITGSSSQGLVIQGNGKTIIAGNTIENSDHPGIHIQEFPGDSTIIRDNIISGGSGPGVEINRPLVILKGNTIKNNQESGIATTSGIPHIIVRDSNLIEENGMDGIYLENSTSSIIQDNIIRNNGENGIMAWSNSTNKIRNNIIEANTRTGILSVGNSTITGNRIASNLNGIEINQDAGSTIIDSNIIENNSEYGVFLMNNALLRGNTISGSGWTGVFLDRPEGKTIISGGNQILNSAQHGILVFGRNTKVHISDNLISGNGTAVVDIEDFSGIWSEGIAMIERNIIDNNHASGIRLLESDGTSIVRNNKSINGNREGIHLEATAIIEKNSISNNMTTGIEIDAPHDILITHDTLTGNHIGIYIGPNSKETSIHNCVISGNKFGLFTRGEAKVRRSTIQKNSGPGVLIDESGIDLGQDSEEDAGYNTFLQDTSWNIANRTSDTIWACHNFWNKSDTLAIDSTLKDNDEDPAKGEIVFIPFISEDVTSIRTLPVPDAAVAQWGLTEIFPNPARQVASIRYKLSSPALISVKVFNILGKDVAILIQNEWREPGNHQLEWRCRSGDGRPLPPGIYVIRMTAGAEVSSKLIKIH